MTSSEMRNVGLSMWNRSTSSSNAAPASGWTVPTFGLVMAISGSIQRAQTGPLHPARVPASADCRHPSSGASISAGGPRSLGVDALERREQSLDRTLQAELGGVLDQALVALAGPQAERRLPVDRDQPSHVVEVAARLEELRPDARLDEHVPRLGGFEHRVDRRELLDERAGGLLADTANAGQAVGGVAAQDRELAVSVRGDAVLRQDACFVVHAELRDATQREQECHDGIAHQLDQVAVAADDLDPVLVRSEERR